MSVILLQFSYRQYGFQPNVSLSDLKLMLRIRRAEVRCQPPIREDDKRRSFTVLIQFPGLTSSGTGLDRDDDRHRPKCSYGASPPLFQTRLVYSVSLDLEIVMFEHFTKQRQFIIRPFGHVILCVDANSMSPLNRGHRYRVNCH